MTTRVGRRRGRCRWRYRLLCRPLPWWCNVLYNGCRRRWHGRCWLCDGPLRLHLRHRQDLGLRDRGQRWQRRQYLRWGVHCALWRRQRWRRIVGITSTVGVVGCLARWDGRLYLGCEQGRQEVGGRFTWHLRLGTHEVGGGQWRRVVGRAGVG